LAQVTEKLNNINLVLTSLLTKKTEQKNELIDEIGKLNNKLSDLELHLAKKEAEIKEENLNVETEETLCSEGMKHYLGLEGKI
jgi:hypothetical protein